MNGYKFLLPILLMVVLAVMPCIATAHPQDKIDAELRAVVEKSDSFEPIGIIIVFRNKPTEDQVNTLKAVHKMEIAYVYKMINGVAGKVPAGEISKIAEYDWVKEIWLDRKVYTMPSRTVETSGLIETLQEENDELRQTISNLNQEVGRLQDQVQLQQGQIPQLGIYASITFIAGAVAVTLIAKAHRSP